jgi:pyrroline-5-carboxylate reductase
MKLGFIGGGYMGEAIVSAALKSGLATADDIAVSDVAAARRKHLATTYSVSVSESNVDAARRGEIVVLAIKPQEFDNVAGELRGELDSSQVVVSIMAGVPLEQVVSGLGNREAVRAMPNTAAFVGEAMTIWTATSELSDQNKAAIAELLQALGREVYVEDEKYLDMATALSGSGPGFVFLFLESMIDAGVHIGLRRDIATELAIQTMFGSAKLARETGKHPAELRNMVTSPGGTTAEGLKAFEEAGLRGTVIGAIEAAYERAKDLGGVKEPGG